VGGGHCFGGGFSLNGQAFNITNTNTDGSSPLTDGSSGASTSEWLEQY
jgi:hypothetical protein